MGPGKLAVVFVGTFIATFPASFICKAYSETVSSNPLVQVANHVFVTQFGSLWLATIFWGTLISAFLAGKHKNLFSNGSAKFCLHMLSLSICNWWFFGASIFERLNVATGGHCESQVSQSISSCKNSLSSWINGFDISGHYFFITTSSILLTHLYKPQSQPRSVRTVASIYLIFQCLKVFILLVWYVEFIITSLFFHTAFEKIGALMAMGAVYLALELPDQFLPIRAEKSHPGQEITLNEAV